KNEAWILDRFLQCTSLWADHIIVADQGSDDGSREIALRYPKVILIENTSVSFNEPERQKILIAAARQFSGPRILIALDADEMLSANFLNSLEWKNIFDAAPGTIIQFEVVNIKGDMTYWTPQYYFNLGFIDDDSEHDHKGMLMHSQRVPTPMHSPILKVWDIKILHYQYSDWRRMESKHRWYQCWERINHPTRHTIDIFRQYHHMYSIPQSEIHPILSEWIDEYKLKGIDMANIKQSSEFRWDKEVLEMFAKYGVAKFAKEAVWEADWTTIKQKINTEETDALVVDPRSCTERIVHWWLRWSQAHSRKRLVRWIDRGLKLIGW
ncbi:MAG: glycosyltransferase family 2 protein, partial [Abditibacteriaceae bacterium]